MLPTPDSVSFILPSDFFTRDHGRKLNFFLTFTVLLQTTHIGYVFDIAYIKSLSVYLVNQYAQFRTPDEQGVDC